MKKVLVLVLMLFMCFGANINADEYVDNEIPKVEQYKIYRKATKKVTTYVKTVAGKKIKVISKTAKYTKAQSVKKAVNYSARGVGKAGIMILAEMFGIASIARGCF